MIQNRDSRNTWQNRQFESYNSNSPDTDHSLQRENHKLELTYIIISKRSAHEFWERKLRPKAVHLLRFPDPELPNSTKISHRSSKMTLLNCKKHWSRSSQYFECSLFLLHSSRTLFLDIKCPGKPKIWFIEEKSSIILILLFPIKLKFTSKT